MGGKKNIENSSKDALRGNTSSTKILIERKRKRLKDKIIRENMQKIKKIEKKMNDLKLQINILYEELRRNEEKKKKIKEKEEIQLIEMNKQIDKEENKHVLVLKDESDLRKDTKTEIGKRKK
jgi:hypothetical protein